MNKYDEKLQGLFAALPPIPDPKASAVAFKALEIVAMLCGDIARVADALEAHAQKDKVNVTGTIDTPEKRDFIGIPAGKE